MRRALLCCDERRFVRRKNCRPESAETHVARTQAAHILSSTPQAASAGAQSQPEPPSHGFLQMKNNPKTISGFEPLLIGTERQTIFASVGGSGPPLLLLHGFPETHLMWREIAPRLADAFNVVAVDLPGYGRSGCPPDSDEHSAMSKRAMAGVLVDAMQKLGHARFAVVGHDRGGRVGYRMALDHAQTVTRIAVLDVIPTAEVWERADARLALAFWPFTLLAQNAPLPERLVASDPAAVVDNALDCWGSKRTAFPPEVRQAYIEALSDPARVHAICEEYRAAAGIDREHDQADRKTGLRVGCPLLALWSAQGGLETWYADVGGPLAIWRRWAEDVQGEAMPGGHFFPEEHPEILAERLRRFLS